MTPGTHGIPPSHAHAAAPDDAATVTPEVYAELRRIAAALLKQERPGHTLQPTALVHEAYLRVGGSPESREGSVSFRGAAATAMRHILVDHARRRLADKRGGGWIRIELPEASVESPEPLELLALDEALAELATLDARMARVVELRFFGGLSGDEIASMLGVVRSTVESDWCMARAWLRRRMAAEP